jgi:hypothetical protein
MPVGCLFSEYMCGVRVHTVVLVAPELGKVSRSVRGIRRSWVHSGCKGTAPGVRGPTALCHLHPHRYLYGF